jgi:hypothetical protein
LFIVSPCCRFEDGTSSTPRGQAALVEGNPLGFILVVGGNVFLIVFGTALVLHAYGVIAADPLKLLKPIFEPFS